MLEMISNIFFFLRNFRKNPGNSMIIENEEFFQIFNLISSIICTYPDDLNVLEIVHVEKFFLFAF